MKDEGERRVPGEEKEGKVKKNKQLKQRVTRAIVSAPSSEEPDKYWKSVWGRDSQAKVLFVT